MFGVDKIVKERASGMFNAKYSGYHHDKGWKLVKKGKVKFLTEPKICPKTGIVSVEKIAVEGIPLKEPKTFFPPEWTRNKVVDKIVEASQNIKKEYFQGTSRVIEGMTQEGMNIRMVIGEERILITAFPIWD